MPIEAVKIPQNVYVEDRIIGPITLRQIVMILVGAGISYAIWSAMQVAGYITIPFTVIAWTPAAAATIFAFVKVNDISMFRLLLLFAEGMEKPKIRKWGPREGVSINILTTKHLGEEKKEPVRKSFQQDNINMLSAMLDKGPAEDEQYHATQMQAPAPQPVAPAKVEAPAAEERGPTRAVNPARVSVNNSDNVIDDIAPQKEQKVTPPVSEGLLRDIHPPRA